MKNTEKYSREKFFKTFIRDLNENKEKEEKKDKTMDKVLLHIYRDLHEAHTYIQKHQNKINSDIKKEIKQPSIYNDTFFPEDIRTYININAKYQLTYTFNDSFHSSEQIKIHYTLFSEDELTYLDNYMEQTQTMLMWLRICRAYAAKMCAEKIDIYIYPTPFNKSLPRTNVDILSAEQVNTAYTYHCPKNGEIVIFRNEEWFKVFLHETFHTYGLDFANAPKNNPVHHTLARIFPIMSEFNATEAYAETWARVMNSAIHVFLALKDKSAMEKFKEYLQTSLALERYFAVFQCNKILAFMGMNYTDLYSTKEKNSGAAAALRRNLYREKTSVFAYYILTSIFMENISSFLGWCETHNSSLLQFNNRSHHSLTEFAAYIEQEYKSDSYNSCLQQMKAQYMQLLKKKKTPMNEFVLTTTRMTLLG